MGVFLKQTKKSFTCEIMYVRLWSVIGVYIVIQIFFIFHIGNFQLNRRVTPISTHIGPYRDRLYGLVVRVPGYKSRGPEFDSRRYQIFWEVVGLGWGPLSLIRINEELLERKVASPV
jgi:hypothetical protein